MDIFNSVRQEEDLKHTLKYDGIRAKGFGIIVKYAMADKKLSIEAKTIYAYLCSYAGNGNTAFPGVKTIISHLNISENRYYRHFPQLINQKYISKTSQKTKDKNTFANNVYTILDKRVPIKVKVRGEDDADPMVSTVKFSGMAAGGYGIIPKLPMFDKRLDIKSKGIYAFFCSLSGNGTNSFPYHNDIVRKLGINSTTYYRYYKELLDYGYIFTEQRRTDGHFGVNDYYINSNPSDNVHRNLIKKLKLKNPDKSNQQETETDGIIGENHGRMGENPPETELSMKNEGTAETDGKYTSMKNEGTVFRQKPQTDHSSENFNPDVKNEGTASTGSETPRSMKNGGTAIDGTEFDYAEIEGTNRTTSNNNTIKNNKEKKLFYRVRSVHPIRACAPVHTRTQERVCAHTQEHAPTYAPTQGRASELACAHTQEHAPVCAHTQERASEQACAHTQEHAPVCAHTQERASEQAHTHTQEHTPTYAPTQGRASEQACTHTQEHAPVCAHTQERESEQTCVQTQEQNPAPALNSSYGPKNPEVVAYVKGRAITYTREYYLLHPQEPKLESVQEDEPKQENTDEPKPSLENTDLNGWRKKIKEKIRYEENLATGTVNKGILNLCVCLISEKLHKENKKNGYDEGENFTELLPHITFESIGAVLRRLPNQGTGVRNLKKYILRALFNEFTDQKLKSVLDGRGQGKKSFEEQWSELLGGKCVGRALRMPSRD
jgi:hypothetical protein